MNSKTSITYSSFSLESIGIIVGIILCILQGTGTINIGWFWATFPFWIVLAVDVAIVILILIVALIVLGIQKIIEKK